MKGTGHLALTIERPGFYLNFYVAYENMSNISTEKDNIMK
jgi:hypothetical protein